VKILHYIAISPKFYLQIPGSAPKKSWRINTELRRKITLVQVMEENRKDVLITWNLYTHRMSIPDVMLDSKGIEGRNIQ